MSSHIFISPHLDDAVLSCGDYIHKLVNMGERVKVITIFTGYPPESELSEGARLFHKQCGLNDETIRFRCLEDNAAMNLLGCEFKHLGVYECLYRKDINGKFIYPNLRNVFRFKAALEQEAIDIVQQIILEETKGFDYVYAPLGIGNHSDHLLTNYALKMSAPTIKGKIFYYQDFPYVWYERNKLQLQDYLNLYQQKIFDISESDLIAKTEAIKLYSSQIQVLFDDECNMMRIVKEYALKYKKQQYSIRLLEYK